MSKRCCGDCRYCLPITQDEAHTIMRHMSLYTVKETRDKIRRALAWALRQCGICAWRTDIVAVDDEGCEEHWRERE